MQFVQLVEFFQLYVPGSQLSQLSCSEYGLNVPASHAKQIGDAFGAYLPGPQIVQLPRWFVEALPAGHFLFRWGGP